MQHFDDTNSEASARARIQRLEASVTKTEQRIARVILSDYPISAMKTLADLGRDASASPATVLRFVAKLGFSGYPEFQRSLRCDLQASLESPLSRYRSAEAPSDGGAPLERYGYYATDLIRETIEMVPQQEFQAVVDLLADMRRPVHLIGGRYSRGLASLFGYGLSSVRGQVREVAGESRDMVNALADFTKRDIVVVFDFRRYQTNIRHFAEAAAETGARVILFTDRWHSPCAKIATHVIALPVASPSLFDTGLSALLCLEAMIAHLADQLGKTGAGRIARIDALYRTISDQSDAE